MILATIALLSSTTSFADESVNCKLSLSLDEYFNALQTSKITGAFEDLGYTVVKPGIDSNYESQVVVDKGWHPLKPTALFSFSKKNDINHEINKNIDSGILTIGGDVAEYISKNISKCKSGLSL